MHDVELVLVHNTFKAMNQLLLGFMKHAYLLQVLDILYMLQPLAMDLLGMEVHQGMGQV